MSTMFTPPKKSSNVWKVGKHTYKSPEEAIASLLSRIDSLKREKTAMREDKADLARRIQRAQDSEKELQATLDRERIEAEVRFLGMSDKATQFAKAVRDEAIVDHDQTHWGCSFCGVVELNDMSWDEGGVHYDDCDAVAAFDFLEKCYGDRWRES